MVKVQLPVSIKHFFFLQDIYIATIGKGTIF